MTQIPSGSSLANPRFRATYRRLIGTTAAILCALTAQTHALEQGCEPTGDRMPGEPITLNYRYVNPLAPVRSDNLLSDFFSDGQAGGRNASDACNGSLVSQIDCVGRKISEDRTDGPAQQGSPSTSQPLGQQDQDDVPPTASTTITVTPYVVPGNPPRLAFGPGEFTEPNFGQSLPDAIKSELAADIQKLKRSLADFSLPIALDQPLGDTAGLRVEADVSEISGGQFKLNGLPPIRMSQDCLTAARQAAVMQRLIARDKELVARIKNFEKRRTTRLDRLAQLERRRELIRSNLASHKRNESLLESLSSKIGGDPRKTKLEKEMKDIERELASLKKDPEFRFLSEGIERAERDLALAKRQALADFIKADPQWLKAEQNRRIAEAINAERDLNLAQKKINAGSHAYTSEIDKLNGLIRKSRNEGNEVHARQLEEDRERLRDTQASWKKQADVARDSRQKDVARLYAENRRDGIGPDNDQTLTDAIARRGKDVDAVLHGGLDEEAQRAARQAGHDAETLGGTTTRRYDAADFATDVKEAAASITADNFKSRIEAYGKGVAKGGVDAAVDLAKLAKTVGQTARELYDPEKYGTKTLDKIGQGLASLRDTDALQRKADGIASAIERKVEVTANSGEKGVTQAMEAAGYVAGQIAGDKGIAKGAGTVLSPVAAAGREAGHLAGKLAMWRRLEKAESTAGAAAKTARVADKAGDATKTARAANTASDLSKIGTTTARVADTAGDAGSSARVGDRAAEATKTADGTSMRSAEVAPPPKVSPANRAIADKMLRRAEVEAGKPIVGPVTQKRLDAGTAAPGTEQRLARRADELARRPAPSPQSGSAGDAPKTKTLPEGAKAKGAPEAPAKAMPVTAADAAPPPKVSPANRAIADKMLRRAEVEAGKPIVGPVTQKRLDAGTAAPGTEQRLARRADELAHQPTPSSPSARTPDAAPEAFAKTRPEPQPNAMLPANSQAIRPKTEAGQEFRDAAGNLKQQAPSLPSDSRRLSTQQIGELAQRDSLGRTLRRAPGDNSPDLPSPARPAPDHAAAAPGALSRDMSSSQIEDLFQPGRNLSPDEILQKADAIRAGRAPERFRKGDENLQKALSRLFDDEVPGRSRTPSNASALEKTRPEPPPASASQIGAGTDPGKTAKLDLEMPAPTKPSQKTAKLDLEIPSASKDLVVSSPNIGAAGDVTNFMKKMGEIVPKLAKNEVEQLARRLVAEGLDPKTAVVAAARQSKVKLKSTEIRKIIDTNAKETKQILDRVLERERAAGRIARSQPVDDMPRPAREGMAGLAKRTEPEYREQMSKLAQEERKQKALIARENTPEVNRAAAEHIRRMETPEQAALSGARREAEQLARRAAAPTFDIPPQRATELSSSPRLLRKVQIGETLDDIDGTVLTMADGRALRLLPSQNTVSAEIVNGYVQEMINDLSGFWNRQRASKHGAKGIEVVDDGENAILQTHHRVIAAQRYARISARPLFGKGGVIPEDMIQFSPDKTGGRKATERPWAGVTATETIGQ